MVRVGASVPTVEIGTQPAIVAAASMMAAAVAKRIGRMMAALTRRCTRAYSS